MTISYTQNSMTYTLPVHTRLTANSPELKEFYFSMKVGFLKDKIHHFVTEKLKEFGVSKKIHSMDIMEMLKNSRESFCSLSSGITRKIGSCLEFKVSIGFSKDKNFVIVKFKDNANGVKGKNKGEFFDVKECKSTKRGEDRPSFFSGGLGLGLKQCNEYIVSQSGTMQLKNRKITGCTIYITFPFDRAQSDLSNWSSVDRIEEKAALSLASLPSLREKKKDILPSESNIKDLEMKKAQKSEISVGQRVDQRSSKESLQEQKNVSDSTTSYCSIQ